MCQGALVRGFIAHPLGLGAGWEVGRVFLLEKITRFAQTSFFLPEKHAPPPAGITLWEKPSTEWAGYRAMTLYTGRSRGICLRTTWMTVMSGTASRTPTGPQSQPQKKMDTKMMTGLMAMRKP